MGRGGRGGRSPTPNDDRSRSMNPQDPVGQAAAANTARQIRANEEDYDDGYDDGKGSYVTINDEDKDDNTHWGVYRDESEKPQEPRLVDGVDFYGHPSFYGSGGWNNLKPKSKSKDK